jgi:hypothetical protein
MRLGASIVLLITVVPLVASAALPPPGGAPTGCPTPRAQSQCSAAQPCSASGKKVTVYVPHGGPNCAHSIQGCVATSMKGLDGTCTPATVDAVRLGKAKYATCASATSNYGKYFNIGTVTYRSALDMKMYTVPNVICYVHDTGCAFNGTCSAGMGNFSSTPRPDKLDLATTICPTCTDGQAGTIGNNGTVAVSQIGLPDNNNVGSPFSTASMQPYTIGTPYSIANPYSAGNPSGFNSGYMSQPPPPPAPQPSYPQSAPVSAAPIASPVTTQPTTQPSLQNQQTFAIQQFFQSLNPNTQSASNSNSLASVGNLIAQPSVVPHGSTFLVSWATLGMDSSKPCTVMENTSYLLARSNNGSKSINTNSGISLGVMTFALECTTQSGQSLEKTAQVTIK